MFYAYQCRRCACETVRRFKMGEQPGAVFCEHCGYIAPRKYTPTTFIFASRRHDQQMDDLDRDLHYAKATQAR